MLVKVFESHEMSSALKMVKETLGPNALILSTRTIRKSGLGVFGRPLLEVTAAIDSSEVEEETRSQRPISTSAPRPKIDRNDQERLSYQDLWRERKVIDPLEEQIKEFQNRLATETLAPLRDEIAELKALIHQQEIPLSKRDMSFEEKTQTTGKAASLECLRKDMCQAGIGAEIIDQIVCRAGQEMTGRQLRTIRNRQDFIRQIVGDLIQFTGELPEPQETQQRLALIGPTGVGKTTTIAKIAANYLARTEGRVALFTIDTYRIAAAEQLKIYGEIMNLPVEVIFTPEDLQEAFDRHADKDLILIDTAGRSHRDEPRMMELSTFLGEGSGVNNHLVLAAPTRDQELEETVRRFNLLPLSGLIFTKLDECGERGSTLNIPIRQSLPVSYLANGQRVPEDLVTAAPEALANFILNQE